MENSSICSWLLMCLKWPGLNWAKTRSSIWISDIGSRSPWAIFHCLLRCTSMKPHWQWSSQDQTSARVECQHHRPHLYLLRHNAAPDKNLLYCHAIHINPDHWNFRFLTFFHFKLRLDPNIDPYHKPWWDVLLIPLDWSIWWMTLVNYQEFFYFRMLVLVVILCSVPHTCSGKWGSEVPVTCSRKYGF